MREEFIIYHMTKVMNKYLEGIAEKIPLAPLDAIRKNVMLFSQDGGKTTMLYNFNAHFYEFIKRLQESSDEEAGLQIVPDGEEPKEPVYMEKPKNPVHSIFTNPKTAPFSDLGNIANPMATVDLGANTLGNSLGKLETSPPVD